MKHALLLLLWLAAPVSSFAGQGYVIQLQNRLEVTQKAPTSADKQYPLVAVHAVDGATCWYDYDLGNWDKYAMAMAFGVDLYTEEEQSIFTSCDSKSTDKLRSFSLFVKTSEGEGWLRISNPMQFRYHGVCKSEDSEHKCTSWYETYILNELTPFGDFSRELARITNGPEDHEVHAFTVKPHCGVQLGVGSSYSWLNGRPTLRLWVEGKYDESCPAAAPASASTAGVLPETALTATPSSTRKVKMQVGQRRKIRLPSLSENTAWELDHCVGDVVTTDGVVPRKQKVKLPNRVLVSAVSRGTEECLLNAWTYSAETATRKLHQTLRYVFEVK